MQPLHDDDDRAGPLIVEPLDDFGVEPLLDGVAACGVVDVRRGDRVVDHDEVGTATDQRATDRRRDATATVRQAEVCPIGPRASGAGKGRGSEEMQREP